MRRSFAVRMHQSIGLTTARTCEVDTAEGPGPALLVLRIVVVVARRGAPTHVAHPGGRGCRESDTLVYSRGITAAHS